MGERLTDIFFRLFCEKNSDGTLHLRLQGQELYKRIGKRLDENDMFKLAKFLKSNPNITSLDLCYNNIGDQGLENLSNEYFNEPNGLLKINLMHCDIKEAGMKAFSSSEHLSLKTCRINGNKLGTAGSRYIASLIFHCASLESLDIAETDQTQESIDSILIVIENSSLKKLNVSRIIPNSYYSKYNTSDLANDLAIMIRLNSNLTQLHMQKCEFDGHDMQLLMSGLEKNTSLLMLDLACNRIGDMGLSELSLWLKTRPNLRGLNVAANNINDKGARSLSYGLPCSKIRYLDISDNVIEDIGMEHLLHTLKKPHMIRMFFIWGNKFGAIVNTIIDRMVHSGVLEQEYIDVKIYHVDGVPHAAYYPRNHYRQKYYCVMDFASPPDLRIKRNLIANDESQPRCLLDLEHIDRYPPVEK